MRSGLWRISQHGPTQGLWRAALVRHGEAAIVAAFVGQKPWTRAMFNLLGAQHAHISRWLDAASADDLRALAVFVSGSDGDLLLEHNWRI